MQAVADTTVGGDVTEEASAYKAPAELGDDLFSGIVQYGDALYQLPAPVSEFVNNGWTIQPENSDEKLAASDTGWVTLMKDNQIYKASVKNYGKSQTTINNCFVVTIESSENVKIALTIQKGISVGISEEDLLRALEGIDYDCEESELYHAYEFQVGDNTLSDYEINTKEGKVYKMRLTYQPKTLD